MASLLAPQPSNSHMPVFFNVDGVVGAAPAENRREDVLLVQFYLSLTAKSPDVTPQQKAIFSAVKTTGTMDAATLAGIRALQEQMKSGTPGTVVDGRISPARGSYSYGSSNWAIVGLNGVVQSNNIDQWPRIDKIAGCPAEVAQMVKRTLVGTP